MSNRIKGHALRNTRPIHNGKHHRVTQYDYERGGCVLALFIFARLLFIGWA